MALHRLQTKQSVAVNQLELLRANIARLEKFEQETERKVRNLCMPKQNLLQSQLVDNYVDFVTVAQPKRRKQSI